MVRLGNRTFNIIRPLGEGGKLDHAAFDNNDDKLMIIIQRILVCVSCS